MCHVAAVSMIQTSVKHFLPSLFCIASLHKTSPSSEVDDELIIRVDFEVEAPTLTSILRPLLDLTGLMPLFEEYFEQYLTSESIPFFLSSLAFGLLVGSTIGIGTFWFVALITRERGEIYKGTLLYSGAIIFSCVCVYALDILDSHIAHWMLVVYTLHALFMVYLVVYSQEILYDARFGDIDFVNCTFTVFLHLPAIVVHAVRLCLGAEIQQHRRN
ncbi:hypothetical protein H5410_012282 [Solanum commersonii]|uniref:Uncharacterized protein n=1 Tax=Solanum commersonii TaxID=4109 RepID=A0A9J6AR01_SOLCO|nr:hypothetical protein H5410_012282 [Solanum commersonii]